MRDKINNFRTNPLLANSFYLMIASGAVAAFGFVFWAVVARQFSDSDVGLAATLLSLSSLISLLSLAGFDSTFVRFLAKSDRRQDYINSGLMISAGFSTVLSLAFALAFPLIAPDLSFVTHNPFYILLFIVFNIFSTHNILTNAIFLAFRKTIYVLGINILFSIAKVTLPFLFASGGAMMIFSIAGVAQVIGVALSFYAIAKYFHHRFKPAVHLDILRLAKKYAFGAYCSSMLNLLPPTILPILVTHQIGPSASAYFFMAFTIATLLYTIAYSVMQSVFAEGSHDEESLGNHVKKGAKFIALLLLPSSLVTIVLAPFVLSIFGENYASQGTDLLRILSVAALFVSTYAALGTILKVQKNITALVFINTLYAITIIGLAYVLSGHYGLAGIGFAWLAGNVVATIAGLFITLRKK